MCEMSLLGYHNKTPQPGWLDNRNLFSYLLEAGRPRSTLEASGLKFGFSLGLCPWFTDGYLLAMSAQGLPSVCGHAHYLFFVQISSYKYTSRLESTIASF